MTTGIDGINPISEPDGADFDKWYEIKQGKVIILEERYATKSEREEHYVYTLIECDNDDWNGIHISEPGGEFDFAQYIVKGGYVNRQMEFMTTFPIPYLEAGEIIDLMTGDASTPWDVNNGDLSIQDWINEMFEMGDGKTVAPDQQTIERVTS